MKKLFSKNINQKSWEHIFQSIYAFESIIKTIFERHSLPFSKIENLMPGTNAVFKVGDKVIKIFAPAESGFYPLDYFNIEIEAQKHVNDCGVVSPSLLFYGAVEDKYLFRYIIMDFIKGQEAGKGLAELNNTQKYDFGVQMKNITNKINISIKSKAIPMLSQESCLANNSKWKDFAKNICDERAAVIRGISFETPVYVHGDLTAENVIIREDGAICLIDFADSLLAPYYYEWMPVVFDLFKCDAVMMAAYFGDYLNEDFYELLTRSVLIHEFGGHCVKGLCEARGVEVGVLSNVSLLKRFLVDCLIDGK